MAKAAKAGVDGELSDRTISSFLKSVLERYENIDTARGRFMQSSRQEREGMTTVYEAMAARGISQKVAKTEIKIIRLIERIKGLYAELEDDERKMVQRLAKAQDDKRQLSLFTEQKPPRAKRAPKTVNGDANENPLPI